MRYTGRVNLKLDGDIPAAQRLIPLARKILGQLYNRNHELGILGPEGQSVHNHTAEDGSEIRVWWNPWEPMIRIIGVEGEPRRSFWSAPGNLIWLPEGFVITPRHPDTAPNGWGLPQTPGGPGTPGGPLRQVIINRFEHNLYPDRVELPAEWQPLSLFYMPDEVPDLYTPDATQPFTQISDPRYVNHTNEPETGQWYCHRPEVYEYRNPVLAEVLTATNALRAAVGRRPLLPPLRGFYSTAARDVAREMAAVGILEHDSVEYKEGYWTILERVLRTGQPFISTGENILFRPSPSDDDPLTGQGLVDLWESSPPHYANIIADWWEEAEASDNVAAFLQTAFAYGTPRDIPEQLSVFASQVILSADSWVFTFPRMWVGDEGVVSYSAAANRYAPLSSIGRRGDLSFSLSNITGVVYKGRLLYVPFEGGQRGVGLAACLLRSGVDLLLRVAYTTAPSNVAVAPVLFVEDWKVEDVPGAYVGRTVPQQRYTYSLPTNVTALNVIFSPSGRKATIAVYSYESLPNTQFIRYDQEDFSLRSTVPAAGLWRGSSLTHVLFDDGTFTADAEQELFVEPIEIDSEVFVLIDEFGEPYEELHNRYHVKCEGSYVAYKDFDGESLVSATVTVDWEVKQKSYPESDERENEVYAKAFTKITFPGGASEFVSVDTEMSGSYTNQSGFVTSIGYMDIRDPGNLVYTKHNIGASLVGASIVYTLSQELFVGVTSVSYVENTMARSGELSLPMPDGVPSTGSKIICALPARGTVFASTGVWHTYCYSPFAFSGNGTPDSFGVANGDVCAATHLADVLPAPLSGTLLGPSPGSLRSSSVFSVAPSFSYSMTHPVTGPGLNVQRAEYKDQTIVATELGVVLGFKAEHGLQGEARYYWQSALPLDTITGVSGMSKNILPIGAI